MSGGGGGGGKLAFCVCVYYHFLLLDKVVSVCYARCSGDHDLIWMIMNLFMKFTNCYYVKQRVEYC